MTASSSIRRGASPICSSRGRPGAHAATGRSPSWARMRRPRCPVDRLRAHAGGGDRRDAAAVCRRGGASPVHDGAWRRSGAGDPPCGRSRWLGRGIEGLAPPNHPSKGRRAFANLHSASGEAGRMAAEPALPRTECAERASVTLLPGTRRWRSRMPWHPGGVVRRGRAPPIRADPSAPSAGRHRRRMRAAPSAARVGLRLAGGGTANTARERILPSPSTVSRSMRPSWEKIRRWRPSCSPIPFSPAARQAALAQAADDLRRVDAETAARSSASTRSLRHRHAPCSFRFPPMVVGRRDGGEVRGHHLRDRDQRVRVFGIAGRIRSRAAASGCVYLTRGARA